MRKRISFPLFFLLTLPLPADSPVEQAWQARYTSMVDAMDWGMGLGLDLSGNLFVAGTSGEDIVTIKYDPEGKELWAVRYDGGDIDDAVDAIVDPSGAVIVTGQTFTRTPEVIFSSIVTLKYGPDGALLWKALEEGIVPSAVTADALGNIYMIGYQDRSGTGTDFLTVKYDAQGKKLWKALFDGSGDYDRPSAVKVDPDGNVYVAGYSFLDGWDGMVVKYDREGGLVWSARLGGSEDTMLLALLLDPSGAIYATGSMGDDDGIFTVKIDGDGDPIWEIRRSGRISLGMALALDRVWNLHVAGSLDSNFAVLKYDPSGKEIWQASLQGPEFSWNFASDIAVDVSGEVTVTGRYGDGAATARYGPDGKELWKAVAPGTGSWHGEAHRLTLDGAGNVFVIGLSGSDILSAKYAPDGKLLWEASYAANIGGWDQVLAITGNPIGSVCVSGISQGDAVTVAYDSMGKERWIARYGTDFTDHPTGIVADREGNIYLGVDSTSDVYIMASAAVSFGWNGRRRWVQSLDPGGAAALAVDPAGNLHMTGSISTEGMHASIAVKLDPDGKNLWRTVRRGEGITRGQAIALDREGNVYITGNFEYSHIGTLKYDRDGREIWMALYRTEEIGWYEARSIAVDVAGNVSITGVASGRNGDWHVIAKYDKEGRELWAARRERREGYPTLATDPLGNLYWIGASGGGSVVAKYGWTGKLLWEVRYEGTGAAAEVPSALAVDLFGNAYLTGFSGTGYATRMISPEGENLWEVRFEEGGVIPLLALGPPGTVYVAGGEKDFVTTKYISGSWEKTFLRGDCDGDGFVGGSVTDAILILNYTFGNPQDPPCLAACDANGDGRVAGEVTDAIYVLSFGFLGGPAPPPPFPGCGLGPLVPSAALGCEDPGSCR